MHEVGIVEAILKIARTAAEKAHAKKVTRVEVEVGDLHAISDESLRYLFEKLAKGTAFEGAALKIDHVPIRAHCRDCGKDVEIERAVFACPECGSFEVSATSGKELNVRSIEVEEEDSAGAG